MPFPAQATLLYFTCHSLIELAMLFAGCCHKFYHYFAEETLITIPLMPFSLRPFCHIIRIIFTFDCYHHNHLPLILILLYFKNAV